jgi:hypothetical protein
MTEPWLRFPVACPTCGREELSALPVAGVAAALLNGSAIPLHVTCHDVYWHASPVEIEQLREYLIVAGVTIQRVSKANSTNPSNIPSAVHPSMSAGSDDGDDAQDRLT